MTNHKIYTIETYKSDGKNCMTRTNKGFTSIELLGILEFAKLEILKQMAGEIKPDKIKRIVK